MIYSNKVQVNNNIDFEIKHLSLELKRKEIQKYNPLHYVLGYTLVSKPWLTYEELYANSN
jgi:hypothetical protein